jgi:hypothetical protein
MRTFHIVDIFGLPAIIGLSEISDPLESDSSTEAMIVPKPECDPSACVGADLRRRWIGDRVGLDVGFEFRNRDCNRAQD